jgi:coproporphyrinogen III oxidase-like Fe-S oxidoreductase
VTPHELIDAIDDVVRDDPDRQLALYVHIPFCASKCHFCDWVVDVPVARLRSEREDRRPYVGAVCQQVRFYGPLLTRTGYRPRFMYWGGGTPTRLSPTEIRAIAGALHESFDLSALQQWSMETTPNDLTAEKVDTMREVGVNRVSLGVQSFNPYQLRRSGRVHDGADCVRAVRTLRAGGIDNFNVDLICSFPGEDADSFAASLDAALALNPPHVSVYPYRATPKTVMAMQLERSVLDAHTATGMIEAYELAMARLRADGYAEYCHGYWVRRPEDEDHDGNHKYDLAGDKLGFGSGAESIIGHHLLWNENDKYDSYIVDPRRFSFAERFSLSRPDLLTAPLGGALMTREGIVYRRFERLTGLSFPQVRQTAYVSRWLEILQECGARYIETDSSLRLDPATIHIAYINHLVSTANAGLVVTRA